jgi:hypothetical protein
MMTLAAIARTQLNKFRYHEKPPKYVINTTTIQQVERPFDIPRRECAARERGKFPRMNVASCESPEAGSVIQHGAPNGTRTGGFAHTM